MTYMGNSWQIVVGSQGQYDHECSHPARSCGMVTQITSVEPNTVERLVSYSACPELVGTYFLAY
jgi:hypothetical protein